MVIFMVVEAEKKGVCKACGHRYDRHIFGGMCLECACQRCIY